MKQIENDTIPFGTFVAFNYFGLVFVKRLLLPDERNHEAIHTRQQIEWLILYATALLVLIPACGLSWRWLCTVPICYHVVLYCTLWALEWLLPPYDTAYRDIALERECYDNQA
ncbi:hypothetical protein, partial [Alistipes putredinis]